MRVLLLLNELNWTRAPKVALDTFAALRDVAEVRTIACTGGPFKSVCAALGPLSDLDLCLRGPIWRRVYSRYRLVGWLRSLRRWSPVYINTVATLPLARWISLPKVPAVLHVHELDTLLEQAMSDCPELMTHWPTRYIAVSQAVVRALESRCGIAADRIALVHEFIPERYLDGAGGVDDPPGDGRLTVGGAGVPRWAKGTTLWLQMVAEVRRLAGSAIRFVWVGVPQGPLGYQFRAEARLLGLDGMIEFIPPSPAPLEHFARFDIFTMTSWEDPCPLVVLENMALGKPVICFAGGGGAPEEVGDSGVVVDGFCPREMARRVVELAGAPQERARLGALARERVRAHFTDRVQVPKIQHELEAVLRRGVS